MFVMHEYNLTWKDTTDFSFFFFLFFITGAAIGPCVNSGFLLLLFWVFLIIQKCGCMWLVILFWFKESKKWFPSWHNTVWERWKEEHESIHLCYRDTFHRRKWSASSPKSDTLLGFESISRIFFIFCTAVYGFLSLWDNWCLWKLTLPSFLAANTTRVAMHK